MKEDGASACRSVSDDGDRLDAAAVARQVGLHLRRVRRQNWCERQGRDCALRGRRAMKTACRMFCTDTEIVARRGVLATNGVNVILACVCIGSGMCERWWVVALQATLGLPPIRSNSSPDN